MNSESAQKEIIHWNIKTFHHLNTISSILQTHQDHSQPKENELQMRDFYFDPSLEFQDKSNRKSFIEQSCQYLQNFTSLNQLAYLQSVSFQHQLLKHKFWNNIRKMYTKNKEQHSDKSKVSSIVWTYRLAPITFFLFAAATLLRVTGIYRMSLQKQMVGLAVAAVLGDFFVRTRKSSDIFYLIPPLSDANLQSQRIDILNKSIVLDGKINQIELHPAYVDQLVEEAQKEQNPQQRKLILQTAGYTVVDTLDFEY